MCNLVYPHVLYLILILYDCYLIYENLEPNIFYSKSISSSLILMKIKLMKINVEINKSFFKS